MQRSGVKAEAGIDVCAIKQQSLHILDITVIACVTQRCGSINVPCVHLRHVAIYATNNIRSKPKHSSKEKEKGQEEYLYSAFYILCVPQSTQVWITQFYLQIHHAFLSFIHSFIHSFIVDQIKSDAFTVYRFRGTEQIKNYK